MIARVQIGRRVLLLDDGWISAYGSQIALIGVLNILCFQILIAYLWRNAHKLLTDPNDGLLESLIRRVVLVGFRTSLHGVKLIQWCHYLPLIAKMDVEVEVLVHVVPDLDVVIVHDLRILLLLIRNEVALPVSSGSLSTATSNVPPTASLASESIEELLDSVNELLSLQRDGILARIRHHTIWLCLPRLMHVLQVEHFQHLDVTRLTVLINLPLRAPYLLI